MFIATETITLYLFVDWGIGLQEDATVTAHPERPIKVVGFE